MRELFNHKFILALFWLLLGSFSITAAAAPKTDIVIFKNGDKLTGEVKSLERGRLRLNTEATGTISIEWDKIVSVKSDQHIQVETENGVRYFGQLLATNESAGVVVDTEYGQRPLQNIRIVSMAPIEIGKPLDVLDVAVMLGYSFAKAGGVEQGTFGLEIAHRTRKRIYALSGSTTINDSEDGERSKRSNLGLDYRRLWQNRWYVSGNLKFEQNDELGLDLRSSIGSAVGRFHIQNNTMLLDIQAGLQFSREKLLNDPEKNDSVE